MDRRILLIIAVILLAGSCGIPRDTRNIANSSPSRGPVPMVSVPAGMNGGGSATWSVRWIGGAGPFTVTWNFGGGAQNIGPIAATSPNTQTVTMINPSTTDSATFTYTVTVRDSGGLEGIASGSYTIGPTLGMDYGGNTAPGGGYTAPTAPGAGGGGWNQDSVNPPDNKAPSILDVRFNGPFMSVDVSDPEGDDVTVTISGYYSMVPHVILDKILGGEGTAKFLWILEDFYAGGSGSAHISARDGRGGYDSMDVEFVIEPTSKVLAFERDTIYVVPTVHRAAVGEPVRFICGTGKLPHPFRFMNGVGVIIEDDAEYVKNSFNVGEIGGQQDDPDGPLWTAVGPVSYLLADNLIQSTPPYPTNTIPAGRERWGFNCTGLGGQDVEGASGVLFNFELTFSQPGVKLIGLQAVDYVNRTYYSDSTSTEYLWGTLMADEYGAPNVKGVDNILVIE